MVGVDGSRAVMPHSQEPAQQTHASSSESVGDVSGTGTVAEAQPHPSEICGANIAWSRREMRTSQARTTRDCRLDRSVSQMALRDVAGEASIGFPMQDEAPPSPEHAPPIEVDRSLLCGTCGYELRGLPVSGVCPECGMAVAASLKAHALRWVAPDYLATLRRGATLLEVGAVFRVASIFVVWFSGFWVGGQGKALLGIGCSLAASVTFALGWWWLTTPDLRRAPQEALFSLRRRARALALALAAVAGLLLTIDALRAQGMAASGLLRPVLLVLWFGLWVAQFFGEVDYFVDLAKRAEDSDWVKWMSTCRWLVPLGLIAVVVGGVIVYLMMLDSARRGIVRAEARRRLQHAVRVEWPHSSPIPSVETHGLEARATMEKATLETEDH